MQEQFPAADSQNLHVRQNWFGVQPVEKTLGTGTCHQRDIVSCLAALGIVGRDIREITQSQACPAILYESCARSIIRQRDSHPIIDSGLALWINVTDIDSQPCAYRAFQGLDADPESISATFSPIGIFS